MTFSLPNMATTSQADIDKLSDTLPDSDPTNMTEEDDNMDDDNQASLTPPLQPQNNLLTNKPYANPTFLLHSYSSPS